MNKIIILLFFLVLLLLIYNKLLNKNSIVNEFFSMTKTPKYNFLDKANAHKIIDKIDTFSKYNKLDFSLRNLRNDVDLANHYKSKLTDWNKMEIQVISWLLDIIISRIPDNYKFLFYDIGIAKYENDVDSGFPHTNKDCIFITNRIANQVLNMYNSNSIDIALNGTGSMIIHECIHIWQRRKPQFFYDLYKFWGFTYEKKIYNFERYEKKSRYNPDGVDLRWVFNLDVDDGCTDCGKIETKSNNAIIPAALYRDDAKTIADVNSVGIYLEKLGNTYIVPPFAKSEHLHNIKEFTEMFGNIINNNYQ